MGKRDIRECETAATDGQADARASAVSPDEDVAADSQQMRASGARWAPLLAPHRFVLGVESRSTPVGAPDDTCMICQRDARDGVHETRRLALLDHPPTDADRMAEQDEPRPGMRGDLYWRKLTQHETDCLIRGELARIAESTGSPEDLDAIMAITGQSPPALFTRTSDGCTLTIQRGGIDSDPRVRILAYRAWGDRDRRWFEPIRVQTYRCGVCQTLVDLASSQGDDAVTGKTLQTWRCPGCRMTERRRPWWGDRGLSGLPVWLMDQFWDFMQVYNDRALVSYLFAVVRAAVSDAAAAEVARDTLESHACATLVRVVRALRAPMVPRHPVLAALLDAVEVQGAGAVQALWRPFLERGHDDRVDVTFWVRYPTEVSTLSFEYRAPRSGGNLWLYACTGGSRGLSGVTPWLLEPTRSEAPLS